MRAVLRIARRSVRRHPMRSAVVVALVLLPVAVLVGVLSVTAGNDLVSERDFVARHGAAQAVLQKGFGEGIPVEGLPGASGEVRTFSPDEAQLRTTLPAGVKLLRGTGGSVARTLPDGSAEVLGWVVDDGDAESRRVRGLVEGRWPSAPGEVAVAVAGSESSVGSVLRVDLPEADLRVVGRWGSPDDPPGAPLLVAAGTFPPDTGRSDQVWTTSGLGVPSSWWAVSGLDDGQLDARTEQLGWQVRPGIRSPWETLGLALFGFTWCGLVAASSLAIGARRRRRELGLLATNGATPRQLRAAVAAEGMVLGAVGAVGGLLAGVAGAAAWCRLSPELLGRDWPARWYLTPAVLAAPVLGWLSATVAGALAGRGVARQTTVDLLAGRAPRPATAPRWLKAGAVASGVSIAAGLLTEVSSGVGSTILVALVVASGTVALVAVPVGIIAALPTVVSRRGVGLRTAARDLHRFGARTAGAVGAVAITLAGATFAGVAQEARAADAELMRGAQPFAVAPTVAASITASEQRIVGGRLLYGDLDDARAATLVADAEDRDLAAGVLRRVDGSDVRLCAANLLDTADDLGGGALVDADGCIQAWTVVVPSTLADHLPPSVAEPLQNGAAVVRHPALSRGVEAPSLQVGGRESTLDLVGVEADWAVDPVHPERSQLLEMVAGGSLVSVLLPASAGSQMPGDRLVDSVVAIGAADLDEGARAAASRWLDGLDGRDDDDLQVARFDPVSSEDMSPAVVLAVGGLIVVVCLAVLGLSLVLVRLESRHEEAVLRTQGATRTVAARVHGWRAALATATAAVPGVGLSIGFLWVVGGEAMLPHPGVLALLLVGLPVLAGLVFAAVGLRTPRRDISLV